MRKPQCVFIHDADPGGSVDAELLAPCFEPSPDDVLEVVAWQPVCAVDAETWYDDSDIPADVIAAHPFVWFR